MADQINHKAPRVLTDARDASVRDIATGAGGDAGDAQQQARRMLADFEKSHPGIPAAASGNGATHARTT